MTTAGVHNGASAAFWAAPLLAGITAALGLMVPDVYPDSAGTDAMLPGSTSSPPHRRRAGASRGRPHAVTLEGVMPAQLVELSSLVYLVNTYAYLRAGQRPHGLVAPSRGGVLDRSGGAARSHADLSVMGVAYLLAADQLHAIVQHKMMLGIQERAERRYRGN